MADVKLEIGPGGSVAMLHNDDIDLRQFGEVTSSRVSHVEFSNELQMWTVRSAKTGKLLAAKYTRQEALEWEHDYYSPGHPGWAELQEDSNVAHD